MTVRLEHANLCVHDIDGVNRFLQTAFPDFRIRRDTTDEKNMRWVHIGNDETYIALNQSQARGRSAWKAVQWPTRLEPPGLDETILLAANIGGDADSVASIGGAIAGALNPGSVNRDWLMS